MEIKIQPFPVRTDAYPVLGAHYEDRFGVILERRENHLFKVISYNHRIIEVDRNKRIIAILKVRINRLGILGAFIVPVNEIDVL